MPEDGTGIHVTTDHKHDDYISHVIMCDMYDSVHVPYTIIT